MKEISNTDTCKNSISIGQKKIVEVRDNDLWDENHFQLLNVGFWHAWGKNWCYQN